MRAPYVVYGVKYIDPVPLCGDSGNKEGHIAGYAHLEHLFQCVSTMMTNHLRQSVVASLTGTVDTGGLRALSFNQ